MANLALRGLSVDMYTTLTRAAKRNHRSMNGEILARLEASILPATANAEDVLARVAARSEGLCLPTLSEGLLRDLRDSGRP
jgi:hypothetical protein